MRSPVSVGSSRFQWKAQAVANGNLNPNVDANANLLPLTETVYSAKDQPTLYDAILRRLKERFGGDYNDLAQTAAAIMMVHVQSYGCAQLAFHVDRSAADTFLSTSRTLAAATRHTEQMYYKIPPATSAGGDFICTFDSPTEQQSTIPKGHRFGGPGGLVFEASESVIVPKGATSISVSVAEGQTFQRAYVADGEPSREYPLSGVLEGKFLAASPLRVYVDGNLWTIVDFFDFEQTNQVEVQYTSAPPLIRFGDGYAGNVPPEDAAINVSYRVISGEAGNISSSPDPDTTTLTSLDPFNVAGVPIPMTVTSQTSTSGGEPPMPLDRVKILAPQARASRGAAVTQPDYRALVNSFSDPTFGKVAQGYAARVDDAAADGPTVGYLTGIQDATDDLVSAVSTANDASDADASAANAAVSAIDAEADPGNVLSSIVVSLQGASNSVLTQSNQINGATSTIGAAINNHGTTLTQLINLINTALAPGSDLNQANDYMARLGVLVATDIGTANGALTAVSATLALDANTVATAATNLDASRARIDSQTSTITSQIAGMSTEMDSVVTSANTMESTVTANVQGLFTHLDGLFASDCSANVVNVPILALGSDNFYTGPSTGLIRATQSYLDGIKEVTQHVNVVSGANGLLYAGMEINGVYASAFTRSEVYSAIEARIDDILRGREFGDPLYLSAPDGQSGIYDSLAKIGGLLRVNVKITQPTSRLDIYGNIIPLQLEVVTKLTDGIIINLEAQE